MEYKKPTILGLRCMELLCIAFVITGFVWASSDLLLATILVKAPVTPISVLLMLYGTIGLFLAETSIRLLNRKLQPKN